MKTMLEARPAGNGKVIAIRCQACGQKLRTGPHNLGKHVRCSKCWHKFLVQAPGAADQSPRPERSTVDVADDLPLSRRSAREELCALEAARRGRLERIGAAAQAAGHLPSEHAAALGEVLEAIEARTNCFNALVESRAPRSVVESARRSLARLAARRNLVLGEVGRQLIASGGAAGDESRTIEHIDARIETVRAWLCSRSASPVQAGLVIVAGIAAMLLCWRWISHRVL
jgi:hypothetical protein